MEYLDWEDPMKTSYAKDFFEKYLTAWNPWKDHDTNVYMHHYIEDDPCLRNTTEILDSHPFEDYTKLLN